jgi:hypothetical protein
MEIAEIIILCISGLIAIGILFLVFYFLRALLEGNPFVFILLIVIGIIIFFLLKGCGLGWGKGKEVLNDNQPQVEQPLKENEPTFDQKEILIQLIGSLIIINNNIVDSEEQLKEYVKKYYDGSRTFKLNGDDGLYSNYKLVKKVFKDLEIPLTEDN